MSNEAIGLIEHAAALLRRPGLPGDAAYPGSRPSPTFSSIDAQIQPDADRIIENENLNSAKLFRTVWRRKFTLIVSTLLFLGAAAAVIFSMTPRYLAEALVVVGNGGPNFAGVASKEVSGAAQTLADPATVQTEVDILRSRVLAAQVTNDLKLWERPEFNPAVRANTGVLRSVRAWITDRYAWARALAGWSPPGPPREERTTADASSPVVDSAAVENTAVDIFSSKLTIAAKTNSRVISIQFEDSDPKLAAAAVNSLLDRHISNQRAATSVAAQDRTRWLEQTVAESRQRTAQSDQAYEQFRAKFEAGGGRDFFDRKLTDTSAQLAAAQLARRDAEMRLAELRGVRAKNVTDYATSEVGNSPVMQSLRQRGAELAAQLAQLSATLGENNPKVQTLKAGIARLNGEMRAEVARLATALEGEAHLAQMKENSLQQSLAVSREAIAGSSDAETRLNALKAEAASSRAVLQSFLTRLEEAKGDTSSPALRPEAEILSRAIVPLAPSKPKTHLLLVIAAVGAMVAGVGVTIARDKADRTFRSSEEIELETGIPALALVPLIRNRKGPQEEVLASPQSFYGEAIRGLYRTLVLQRHFKMLVVTSAYPNEGKTTLAASLALVAAQSGREVLLIDADLRRSGASKTFGLVDEKGFAEVISGKELFTDVVANAVPSSNFHFLASGKRKNTVAARAALENATDLFRRLRDRYDLIIIDSPPVLAVSDAMVLSAQADATLFAVRWGATSRTVAKLGLKRLLASSRKGTMAGIVLTMVNAREHVKYGYSDSAFYSKELLRYHRPT